ncbi:MAG: YqjF family protein [Persicimonas sp.]
MTTNWDDIAHRTDHRPWPTPRGPWVMTMSWVDLLFAHWPVAPEKVAPLLPEALTLDTYGGHAWISVVPFEMDNVYARGTTWWPRPMRFPELNLRTYVTVEGDKPGVWFFSLDTTSRLSVFGARTFFFLPYFQADMEIERERKGVRFRSRRTHRGEPNVGFSARYEPTGPVERHETGSLDHWLVERYCLYAADSKQRVYRVDVNHPPWPLQPARARIDENTIGRPAGLELEGDPPLVHFAKRLDVVAWFRHPVDPTNA